MTAPLTGAEVLIARLHALGVTTLFGYPGGQLTPLYDALQRHGGIRHVLARHEQGAAFMADGYARATGQPGVCLAVCGPGVYNAATALATAFTDSIPILLISGQMTSAGLGLRSGFYHENEQLQACATLTKVRVRAQSVREIAEGLDHCWQVMQEGRPGPALLEIPLDVQRAADTIDTRLAGSPTLMFARAPVAQAHELALLLQRWRRPLLLVGGGVVSASATPQLTALAERLGAPVLTTFMGKSAIANDHPMHAGLPWSRATSDLTDMHQYMSPLLAVADGMLAIGCRFSQACTASWALKPPRELAQIDIDPTELGRHYPLTLGIAADARQALLTLLEQLPAQPREPWSRPESHSRDWRLPGIELLATLRAQLPRNAIVVADITRLGYIMLADFPVYEPRTLLHPAGFVSMGYGLPAALGAKAAYPERPVVAVMGDGCLQMTGMELASAVQEQLPIVVIVLNDRCLTLIQAIQDRRYEGRRIGVALGGPDFVKLAEAFGVRAWRVQSDVEFAPALQQALACGVPALIEVQLPQG